ERAPRSPQRARDGAQAQASRSRSGCESRADHSGVVASIERTFEGDVRDRRARRKAREAREDRKHGMSSRRMVLVAAIALASCGRRTIVLPASNGAQSAILLVDGSAPQVWANDLV